MNVCPFCTLPPERILLTSAHGVIIRDGYPITSGHTLVIPRRHVDSFFNLTAEERVDLLGLLDQAKAGIEKEFKPATYNIGINDGPAAGQTVSHLHIHLIPRYTGDVPDARGGVRWIIPDRADYWSHR